jgi:hypothetical protein
VKYWCRMDSNTLWGLSTIPLYTASTIIWYVTFYLACVLVLEQSESVLLTSPRCICMWTFLCLSVCLSILGVNRFNFSTTSLTLHKFGMNFLSFDGTPTLYFLFSFLQPVVLRNDIAGMRICEVGVTLTCFTVVASLWCSLALLLITVRRYISPSAFVVYQNCNRVGTLCCTINERWIFSKSQTGGDVGVQLPS